MYHFMQYSISNGVEKWLFFKTLNDEQSFVSA